MTIHFNPRSPCGERPVHVGHHVTGGGISIHAPRVGSDWPCRGKRCYPGYFNPRSPCGERRKISTSKRGGQNFNPRSPCGERRQNPCQLPYNHLLFQSTLPVWGATTFPAYEDTGVQAHFNPRSPCGERLPPGICGAGRREISIHAPRVRSDKKDMQNLF